MISLDVWAPSAKEEEIARLKRMTAAEIDREVFDNGRVYRAILGGEGDVWVAEIWNPISGEWVEVYSWSVERAHQWLAQQRRKQRRDLRLLAGLVGDNGQ